MAQPTQFSSETTHATASPATPSLAPDISHTEEMAKYRKDASEWIDLGINHLDQKNYSDAERYFEQYLEKEPDDPAVLTLLGVAKMGQKLYAEGSFFFRQALDLNGDLDIAKLYLGEVYCYLGQFEKGIELLEKVFYSHYDEGKEPKDQVDLCRRAGATLGALTLTVKLVEEEQKTAA